MKKPGCFRCGEQFTSSGGRVIFRAYGTYGSVVYDSPVNMEEHLQITVCDNCMTAQGREGNVLQCLPPLEDPPPRVQLRDPDYNPYAGVSWEEEN